MCIQSPSQFTFKATPRYYRIHQSHVIWHYRAFNTIQGCQNIQITSQIRHSHNDCSIPSLQSCTINFLNSLCPDIIWIILHMKITDFYVIQRTEPYLSRTVVKLCSTKRRNNSGSESIQVQFDWDSIGAFAI